MTRNIDELNNLKPRAIDPKIYFGEMDLDEEEIERRIEFTEKANSIFDLILVLLMVDAARYIEYRDRLESELLFLINEYAVPDDYLIDYVEEFSYNFVDITRKHPDEAWYTSSDRALFNAENSANDVLNYDLYQKAIEEGKTHKKWITEKDNKVRETHRRVEGKVIPIKDFFDVGGILMRFPKDMEYAIDAPQETVNCRCTAKYLDSKEKL